MRAGSSWASFPGAAFSSSLVLSGFCLSVSLSSPTSFPAGGATFHVQHFPPRPVWTRLWLHVGALVPPPNSAVNHYLVQRGRNRRSNKIVPLQHFEHLDAFKAATVLILDFHSTSPQKLAWLFRLVSIASPMIVLDGV